MNTLTATLDAKEWDYIGQCLMARPYSEVAQLIIKLQTQLQVPPEPAAQEPVGT